MNRYPYHRYLVYQALNGDGARDIVEHMSDLEYIPPLFDDVEELCLRLRRRSLGQDLYEVHGVKFFDDGGESRELMNWIVNFGDIKCKVCLAIVKSEEHRFDIDVHTFGIGRRYPAQHGVGLGADKNVQLPERKYPSRRVSEERFELRFVPSLGVSTVKVVAGEYVWLLHEVLTVSRH